ncbi:hypothetical protein BD769DRAFT_1752344 [Suillus cothurnatus]|nr:hypothetical protein BD769DRAFT_1752344 [Suillus cothurnatus]
MELDLKLRQKFKRFRILIIGRANARKTTILQRVCKTQENPEIYNSDGEQIDPAVLMASREVGCILDGCNPGFVFHDSHGFEAGGQFEVNKVKAFISRHSKEKHLSDRIHVIWYCIPMDEDGRSFTEAEVKFLSQCDTGSIVVIVLFTKFDALYDDEFAELICKGVSRKDAQALAVHHAKEAFASGPQLKLLYNHKGNHHHPRCHICLPDMDKDNADCRLLIELTAETLDNDVLKQMFVSTQQTTLELCMRYAVKRSLARHLDTTQAMTLRIFGKSNREIVNDLGKWFPQATMMAWDYDAGDLVHIILISKDWQEELMSVHPIRVALQQYTVSPNAAAVRVALSSAVHTYEIGFSRWIAGSVKHSHKKADLIKTITEVVLSHRLPIPGV